MSFVSWNAQYMLKFRFFYTNVKSENIFHYEKKIYKNFSKKKLSKNVSSVHQNVVFGRL